MCIKNGILRVLFSGRSFIDFQGGALRAPPRENRPLSDVGFERGKCHLEALRAHCGGGMLCESYGPAKLNTLSDAVTS